MNTVTQVYEFVWLITSGVLPEKVPSYTTNAIEAFGDMLLRLAQQGSSYACTPDTDVYNIGLSMYLQTKITSSSSMSTMQ